MSKLPPACVTSKGWSTIIRSVSRPKYPPNSLTDQILWLFFQHPFRGSFADTAGILSVPIIDLLLKFFPRELDPSCINDNHKITGIKVWGKNRLVFSPQNFRDFTGHATQHSSLSVDHVPFSLSKRFFSLHPHNSANSDLFLDPKNWRGRRDSNSRPPA